MRAGECPMPKVELYKYVWIWSFSTKGLHYISLLNKELHLYINIYFYYHHPLHHHFNHPLSIFSRESNSTIINVWLSGINPLSTSESSLSAIMPIFDPIFQSTISELSYQLKLYSAWQICFATFQSLFRGISRILRF